MEANIYCFICRQNWWILVFAGINGILSMAHSNIPPGCTCCLRQSTGKSDLQVWASRPRGDWNPLSKLIINYFFPNFSRLFKFWILFLWSNACPSSFSWPVSRIIFPPCKVKTINNNNKNINNNVLQLGDTFGWVLSHLIRHPWWTKPIDFFNPSSMELNFVSDQNPWYLCWFHRWWNFIFQFYKLILQIFGENHPTM